MRPLPTPAVFSRADTRDLGWSDAALTRAVRRGQVIRLRRDQFTLGVPDPVLDAVAAARNCRGSVISHRSAALLHGLPLIGRPPPVPELTVPPSGTGDLGRAHLHRATLRDADVVELNKHPVTSVARTVVDLGRHRSTAAAVTAADFALHQGLTDGEQLLDVLTMCRGWYRSGRAARSLDLVDARAESPLESISRLAMRRLALPVPVLQQNIGDLRGRFIARSDFYWDEYGVVGEADGQAKLQTHADLIALKARQENLEELDLVVVRWGWDDVVRTPSVLDARLRRALDRGRRRDALGLPRRWVLLAAGTPSATPASRPVGAGVATGR